MRSKLIAAGVRNLKEFGYPKCDEKNILTDYLYASFFIKMLVDNKGHGVELDRAIEGLIVECRATIDKGMDKDKPKKGRVVKRLSKKGA